jgi:hypothetical protein
MKEKSTKQDIIEHTRVLLRDPDHSIWSDDRMDLLFNLALNRLNIQTRESYDLRDAIRIIDCMFFSAHQPTPPVRQRTSDYFRTIINALPENDRMQIRSVYAQIKKLIIDNIHFGTLALALIHAEIAEEGEE